MLYRRIFRNEETAGMSDDGEKTDIHRGLKGVYFDRSQVCFIDGRAGELLYRGYSIHDLAQRSTFEETCYLLMHGELPTASELSQFDAALKAARTLPPAIYDVVRAVKHAHPMDVLRTATSALASFDPDVDDNSVAATLAKGVRLTSQVPIIIAAHEHIRNGREPVAPDPEIGHAANFLRMLKGKPPSGDAARLMDIDMILHAEHGSNASAIAALSGPAHGGAAENVMRMAQEIGDPANAADYVKRKRANKEAVMGFGHRVYRAEDPRARHMRAGVERLSQAMGEPKWYRILAALVDAMKPYARHGVNVNVDFYAGVVYFLNGIAEDLFVPIFAAGRVPGWTVQVVEQLSNNILIRPLTLYNGPAARTYVPIERR
jgi:citrate synthase